VTEYEKMLAGSLYKARDAELVRMRRRARGLLDRLNASLGAVRTGERLTLCRRIFGKTGKGLWLQPPFYCDYGKNIELGDNVYFNFNCTVLDVAKVIIGSNVLIGPNVQIYTAGHPIDFRRRRRGLEFGKSITIGNDVWIGGGAILCPGIRIGEKSVIGGGAVVTKNVPSGTVVGGNPARILRRC
jgi:maltose O-acetyltransferase